MSALRSRLARTAAAAMLFGSAVVMPVMADDEAPVSDDAPVTDQVPPADTTPVADPGSSPSDPALLPIRVPIPAARLAQSNYGMNMFLWGNAATTDRDLYNLTLAGFGWQKTVFEWRAVEHACKNCFDWTEADRVVAATNKAGVKMIARVDFAPAWTHANGATSGRPDNLQDYADFLRVLADRYKAGSDHGTVAAVEIWNEPNLQREWGTPISQASAAEYVDMVKQSYAAIKSKAPEMLVVTAGLSPTGWSDDTAQPDDQYLQWMFDAGLAGNYDVLGVHGNSQAPDPFAAPGSIPGMEDGSFYFRRVEQLRAIQVANGDAAKPVWLMEFGWTSDPIHPEYSWYAVSEQQKADNIMNAFAYARANWPWMGVMNLWSMPDPNWVPDQEEYWWAVTNPDGSFRPAMDRIVDAAQLNQLP